MPAGRLLASAPRIRSSSGLSGILLTALVFSLAFIPFGGIWPAVLIGAFLSFLMINLLSMCLAVVRETLEEQAFSAARRRETSPWSVSTNWLSSAVRSITFSSRCSTKSARSISGNLRT